MAAKNMSGKSISVLLIEDNALDARLAEVMLSKARGVTFRVERATLLWDAIKRLRNPGIDVALLDLRLPDSMGYETFQCLRREARETAIVLLTGTEDEALALEAVREGAQDYLFKTRVDSHQLSRTLVYAVERQKLQVQQQNLSLTDELTGLFNRRGFLTLGEQQKKQAQRAKEKLLLVFADMDGLKNINDTWGHKEGDRAIADAARLIKESYRDSDIVGRLGGDEFIVLMLNGAREQAEASLKRLQEKLDEHNASGARPYALSLSLGVEEFDPQSGCSLEEMIAKADAAMYEQKRAKEQTPAVGTSRGPRS